MQTSLQDRQTKSIAVRGVLVAVAMVLSWLESQIPLFFAVPGMKLGLTNLVVLVALYLLGRKDAIIINFVRIVLVGISFGNAFSMLYSLAGGLLSGGVMILLQRSGRFSVIGVSLAGGISHNIGQILLAMLVLETSYVLYYLPVLWISGIAAGVAVGFLGAKVIKRLPVLKTASTAEEKK